MSVLYRFRKPNDFTDVILHVFIYLSGMILYSEGGAPTLNSLRAVNPNVAEMRLSSQLCYVTC